MRTVSWRSGWGSAYRPFSSWRAKKAFAAASPALDELSARDGLVLATGGGAVLSPINRDMLQSRGRVVYLQASAADLWQRLRRDRHRPLLRTANPRERIHRLTAEREPLYLEVADHIVTTSRQPIEQIVETIVQVLQAQEDAPTHTQP